MSRRAFFPSRGGAFDSKVQGFMRRKPAWWCLQCDDYATLEKGTATKTKMYCANCGSRGHYFPSTGQLKAYCHLAMLRDAGEIEQLELEPAFPITINGIRVCTYRADFAYVERGVRVVSDYKGNKDISDNASTLRRKLAEATYGITIKLVEA